MLTRRLEPPPPTPDRRDVAMRRPPFPAAVSAAVVLLLLPPYVSAITLLPASTVERLASFIDGELARPKAARAWEQAKG